MDVRHQKGKQIGLQRQWIWRTVSESRLLALPLNRPFAQNKILSFSRAHSPLRKEQYIVYVAQKTRALWKSNNSDIENVAMNTIAMTL